MGNGLSEGSVRSSGPFLSLTSGLGQHLAVFAPGVCFRSSYMIRGVANNSREQYGGRKQNIRKTWEGSKANATSPLVPSLAYRAQKQLRFHASAARNSTVAAWRAAPANTAISCSLSVIPIPVFVLLLFFLFFVQTSSFTFATWFPLSMSLFLVPILVLPATVLALAWFVYGCACLFMCICFASYASVLLLDFFSFVLCFNVASYQSPFTIPLCVS